jgi:hypothetical protein
VDRAIFMNVVSDFHEIYDVWADGSGPTLTRLTTGGPDRREQLRLLQAAGFPVPPHGRVCDVMGRWWPAERRHVHHVVWYEDPGAHRGDGKRVVANGSVPEAAWQGFCTAFAGDPSTRPSISWRRLQIGRHVAWLEYRADADWRSNVGPGDISLVGFQRDAGYHMAYPLFAVDFVLGQEMWAVDLNVAPGLRGCGLERHLSTRDIYEAIETACVQFASD